MKAMNHERRAKWKKAVSIFKRLHDSSKDQKKLIRVNSFNDKTAIFQTSLNGSENFSRFGKIPLSIIELKPSE